MKYDSFRPRQWCTFYKNRKIFPQYHARNNFLKINYNRSKNARYTRTPCILQKRDLSKVDKSPQRNNPRHTNSHYDFRQQLPFSPAEGWFSLSFKTTLPRIETSCIAKIGGRFPVRLGKKNQTGQSQQIPRTLVSD